MALFGQGGLLGPITPGGSGFVNPLSMMFAGLAQNNPMGALTQIGQMQQAGLQLQQQRDYRQAMMEKMQQELELKRQAAEQTQAQQAAQQAALQAYLGPQATPAQQALAAAAPQAYLKAAVQQQFAEPAGPAERKILKDAAGRQRYVDTGELVFPGMEPMPAELPKFTEQQGLRKEYQALSEDWVTIRDRYEQIRNAADSGAGDTARIIGLMKMLDPTSVVQPGEAATAANAAGVPESIRAMWNSFLGKGRLSSEARRQIEQQAGTIFRQQAGKQIARESDFRMLAERRGWDPEEIVRDLIGDKGRELISGEIESRPELAMQPISEVEMMPASPTAIQPLTPLPTPQPLTQLQPGQDLGGGIKFLRYK